jgi:hypothetical protein
VPEVEQNATSVTKDDQATTTTNNFGNTNIREDQSETHAAKHPRGGITHVTKLTNYTKLSKKITRRNRRFSKLKPV